MEKQVAIIKKIDDVSFIVIINGVEYLPQDENEIEELSQYDYMGNLYMLHPDWYEDIKHGIEVPLNKIGIMDESVYVVKEIAEVEIKEEPKLLYTIDDINKAIDFGTELAQTAGFEEGHDSWIESKIDAFIESLRN
jgi:hypothetical protein